jgi:hypothetical protein
MKDTGAFRGNSNMPSHDSTYSDCDVCGLVFEKSIRTIRSGLGSSSRPIQLERRPPQVDPQQKKRDQEISNRFKQVFFKNVSRRCTCDPVGDLVILKERSELEARQAERARQQALRDAEISSASPAHTSPLLRPLAPSSREVLDSNSKNDRIRKAGEAPLVEQLRQLTDLFNSGALSREQFESAKNMLLGL